MLYGGPSPTLTIVASINPGTPGNTVVNNTVTVTSITPESDLSNNSDTESTLLIQPDITTTITAEPNIMHGTTNFNLIIQVTELLYCCTYGTITVFLPKDSRWALNGPFDQTATMIGNTPVNNAFWNYSADESYHIFTSDAPIDCGLSSTFGFHATWDAEYMTGKYTITAQILSWSGGECRIDNNVDAEKLDYFIE